MKDFIEIILYAHHHHHHHHHMVFVVLPGATFSFYYVGKFCLGTRKAKLDFNYVVISEIFRFPP